MQEDLPLQKTSKDRKKSRAEKS